jgi:hypothetical protein
MSKLNDVVSWVIKDDKIIKLQNSGKVFDISDEVFNYLDKAGLFDKLEDKPVEVEVDETKGQDGTVTRLKLSDGKAEEPKSENASPAENKAEVSDQSKLVVKEMTVGGVSVDKAGVIFKDEDKVWYTLDSTLNAQKFKDECTKKVVEVTIAPQEKGNDVIKGYVLKEEEKKDEPKESGKKSYKGTGNSIEAQAAMKAANVITSNMVDKDSKPDFVEKLITRIAEHNFKTIQDLKNKE